MACCCPCPFAARGGGERMLVNAITIIIVIIISDISLNNIIPLWRGGMHISSRTGTRGPSLCPPGNEFNASSA